ncbi:abortive infection family protein [Roseicyclus mahoneyensis]|uniref:Abortive infection Abi-like protein n=1 Tax=Roseicyclus mahoneyensis TaxID=164332 RepID=A0A316GAR5_9RHOB|nr:abortive infection family protein [Roseicyclus mahoneyensis]PWK57305.1 abortive infection Abi-like protein [Roseicyclus mahoneyensis]
MSELYPNITRFCVHWAHAPMIQQTLDALQREYAAGNDAAIDAAKCMVECACKTLVQELDHPGNPIKTHPNSPIKGANPTLGDWLAATTTLLSLVDERDDPMNKIVSQYNKLVTELGEFRKKAGPLSHGKIGFVSRLSEHHRRMAVIAADTIVGFLHDAYLDQQTDPVRTFEPYERFEHFNQRIDAHISFISARIEDGLLLVGVAFDSDDRREIEVSISQFLFGLERETYKEAQMFTATLPFPTEEVIQDD